MSWGLWSHALVISSSVDTELWSEVVKAFVQAELGPDKVGRAAMRASYTLFAGLTRASGMFWFFPDHGSDLC